MQGIKIISDNATGYVPDPRGCEGFICIAYTDGGYTYLPNNFFRSWQDSPTHPGTLHIGKCSSFGIGSLIKFDHDKQAIHVGSYVTSGLRVELIPGGNHETNCLSTCHFSSYDNNAKNPDAIDDGDMVIKNDVWIGDEAMILGGSTIEDGCVIGARTLVPRRFKSEPYGIYGGVPARLLKFRFPENIIERLLQLKWWDKPFAWVKANNDFFMKPVTLELLDELAHAG